MNNQEAFDAACKELPKKKKYKLINFISEFVDVLNKNTNTTFLNKIFFYRPKYFSFYRVEEIDDETVKFTLYYKSDDIDDYIVRYSCNGEIFFYEIYDRIQKDSTEIVEIETFNEDKRFYCKDKPLENKDLYKKLIDTFYETAIFK